MSRIFLLLTMQTISLICNLEILGKYSNRIELLDSQCEKSGSSKTEFNIIIYTNDNLSTNDPNLFDQIKSIAERLYTTDTNFSKVHLSNIFYLLDELNQELYQINTEYKAYYSQTIVALEFLRKLLSLKESSSKLELVIRKKYNVSENVTVDIGDEWLIDPNLLGSMIERFKQLRFTNDVFFNSIEPKDFNSKRVSEILEAFQPESIQSQKFQLAHYSHLILKYLETECGSFGKKSKAEYLRFIFDLLSVFKLSPFIVDPARIKNAIDASERNKIITLLFKKFLENHSNLKDSTYNKRWEIISPEE